MKSKRTQRFRELLGQLPTDVQRQAYAAYHLFKSNPAHPSLRFKRLSSSEIIYSVRIGIGCRALGRREGDDLIIWFWIGSHADYDKLTN